MDNKKLYIWSAFVAAAILVFFGVGTLFDLKVSEILYFRDNAFGKIYEAIGKMPAFVIAVFACFALGEEAHVKQRSEIKRFFFYICGYLAGILTFMDFGEMLLSSKLYSVVLGAILSLPLSGIAYIVLRNVSEDKLSALKKWALVVLFSVAVTGVAVFVLKTIWGRARYVDTQTGNAVFTPWYKLVRTGGDSFPSGHAAFGGTLFLTLPLCAVFEKMKGKEKVVFAVSLVFVAIVMFARITDGHHYLSDVTAGFGISFVVQSVVMLAAYGKKLDRQTFDTSNKLERLLDAVF